MTFIWALAQMAEGLVAFVEGDKARGQKLLGEGAAENPPDDLRKFADIVVLLGNIPGVSQYAGPVLEVAEVLKSKAAEAPSSSSRAKRRSGASSASSAGSGDAGDGSAAAIPMAREPRVT